MKPTLYIIDDDTRLLDALSWVAGNNDIETETYDNAKSFLADFEPGHPGCVLIDIQMPDINGMELHHRLKKIDSHLPVVLITGFGNISLAVEAMKSGAFDFIEKPVDNDVLLATIKQAFAVSAKYYKTQQHIKEKQAPLNQLSKRELDVFNLVVQGFSSKIIGEKLIISQKTVETHRSNIMKKTKAKSLSDLIILNGETSFICE